MTDTTIIKTGNKTTGIAAQIGRIIRISGTAIIGACITIIAIGAIAIHIHEIL